MSAPFRAQAYNRVVLLQTAAEWAETTDKVLQDYETGRETDTGYEKTGDGVSTWAELAYDDPTPTPGGVKVYRALLTQASTEDPTANVLENTLGGEVVWTYADPGQYVGTLTNAFTVNKTFITATSSAMLGGNGAYFIGASSPDANGVTIVSIKHDGTLDDGFLTNASIEILVYP